MLEKYNLLRQDFLSLAEPCINSDVLNQLKCNYAHDIDSKRKLSKIKDFKSFIRLLEKRDIVSYKNIEQLWFISKTFVGKSNLDNKLLDYEDWLETTQLSPFYNMYKNDEVLESLQHQEHAKECLASFPESACTATCNLSGSSTQNSITSSNHVIQILHSYRQDRKDNPDKRKLLQQKVLLQIKDRLGRSWRDVARRLNIRECEIDAIQSKYPNDLKKQSYEFLRIYMSQSDTERWAINLIRALEKGRRRDLKELVEELVLENNI